MNPWLNPLKRGYEDIVISLKERLKIIAPEMTDLTSNNPLIILGEFFAGCTEQLNYYIDISVREFFLQQTKKLSNAIRLSNFLDYRIKGAIAASSTVFMKLKKDGNDYTLPSGQIRILPSGTLFLSEQGYYFILTENFELKGPVSSFQVAVSQKVSVTNLLGTTVAGQANQAFKLTGKYVNDSLTYIDIAGEIYTLVNTLSRSKSTDLHFITEMGLDGEMYIKFGNGQFGKIPIGNTDVIATYYITDGINGNIQSNSINTIVNPPSFSGGVTIEITSSSSATGGSEYENLASIKISAPLSIRTLDRAVTRKDHIDLAKTYPGVGKAHLYFECGKTIDIYIYPIGGGIASNTFCKDVELWFDSKKMVCTFINVKPVGESFLVLDLAITGKFRMSSSQITQAVNNVLSKFLNSSTSEINKKVRKSDIYAIIDNLPEVEYVDINYVYVKPYAKPIGQTINQLIWNPIIGSSNNSSKKYQLVYLGDNFRLYEGGIYLSDIPTTNPIYSDQNISFEITLSSYLVGDRWEFVTIPYNQNIELSDYTVPILNISNVSMQITENFIGNEI